MGEKETCSYFVCCLALRGVHGIGSVKPVRCPEIIAKGCDSTILLGLMEDNKYDSVGRDVVKNV